MANRREEVYNVRLADVLTAAGATNAEAEASYAHEMPDVLFEWFGLTVVLEAKYDDPGAGLAVKVQLEDRLAAGFATLGVGLLYPPDLKTATGDVVAALEAARFRVQLLATGMSTTEWHQVDGVEQLAAVLDQARSQIIDDNQLDASVDLLSESVNGLARALSAQVGHATEIVSFVTLAGAGSTAPTTPEEKEAAFRVAALAAITATMLQMVLSDRDSAVPKVKKVAASAQRLALVGGWQTVLDHDYRAVFEIAHQIMNAMGDGDQRLGAALVSMVAQAESIVAKGVFGRHDLVGRIYHRLLTSQKYLATYYTSVSAATLLATLVTAPAKWLTTDWAAEPDEFQFRFADPACGTGTLLAACLGAVRRHYAAARRAARKPVDGVELGRHLIEDNIDGFDILAYAVQVCASTLLLSSPGTVISRSRLYQLPFGGKDGHLGSLDLLMGAAEGSLFGAWGDRITGDGVAGKNVVIAIPQVDLVIMNPPFTRTQGGSRLLGSLDEKEWPTARKNLDRLAKRPDVQGRIVAGLGALFVPLADRMVKDGGRMALVLPKTMLTGTQWDRTRHLLSSKYQVEMVISSHEPGHWNFSDSTNLAEILLIARRLSSREERGTHRTVWVQLTKNPRNPIDALGVATSLLRMGDPGALGQPVALGSEVWASFGHAFSRPAPATSDPWRHGTFASPELDLVATAMDEGEPVYFPRVIKGISIPLKPLSAIATVGPDRARLHDGFVRSTVQTGYNCFWGHSAKHRTIEAEPNVWLSPSGRRTAEHSRRYAAELWSGASRLLVAERLRLTTHATAAILLSDRALANTMWPVRLKQESDDAYKILAMWMNATLGLIAWVGASEETEGPWLSMKKNKLLRLNVLDPAALTASQTKVLLNCWGTVHSQPLIAVGRAADDSVRGRIDAAFGRVLGIPADGLESVRQLFSAEPRLKARDRVIKSPKDRAGQTDSEETFLF